MSIKAFAQFTTQKVKGLYVRPLSNEFHQDDILQDTSKKYNLTKGLELRKFIQANKFNYICFTSLGKIFDHTKAEYNIALAQQFSDLMNDIYNDGQGETPKREVQFGASGSAGYYLKDSALLSKTFKSIEKYNKESIIIKRKKIDVLNLEDEYWNAQPKSTYTRNQWYTQFWKRQIQSMDSIKRRNDGLITEAYLGNITNLKDSKDAASVSVATQVDDIDLFLTRILLHFYVKNPKEYYTLDSNYRQRLKDFSANAMATTIIPIFSAEWDSTINNGSAFLGKWLRQNNTHTPDSAVYAFYSPVSPLSFHSAGTPNTIVTNSCMWFKYPLLPRCPNAKVFAGDNIYKKGLCVFTLTAAPSQVGNYKYTWYNELIDKPLAASSLNPSITITTSKLKTTFRVTMTSVADTGCTDEDRIIITAEGCSASCCDNENLGRPQLLNCAPNPAANNITVYYRLDKATESAKIVIINMLGKKINQFILTREGTTMDINCSDLTDGIYFYTLIVDGYAIETKKMIIRK